MKIELHEIKIRDLVIGYTDNQDEGVYAFGGKLNIRPKYQREFVYKDAQRDAVIDTVQKNFPLNVMYWVKNEDDYEVLDGQQRTISICQYVTGEYSINARAWHNLTTDEKEKILDYTLMIYFCEGTDSEKLAWFKIINIAGEKLTDQELRNAVYTGTWLTDAKRYFSKNNCAAHNLGKDYINAIANRQEILETAISWISNGKIEDYMSKNQNEPNANELWLYFQNVINWIKVVFPNYRKEMKGLPWGELFNKYSSNKYDSVKLENKIKELMMDDDVTKKTGIYIYLLTGDEKYLSIRAFTESQKRSAYEKQNGNCPLCKEHFEITDMEGDHITPWSEGGKTDSENLQMLCKECNRRKGKK
ncbi:MAG: HNH endonuclease [Spirochaetaceae bacterium]|nr:HNH endonuclease [Spirochaetaceae bacterium]